MPNQYTTLSVTKECGHCSALFRVPHCRSDGARYCSSACYHTATRLATPMTCGACGKSFLVGPAVRGRRRYCSRACYATVQRLGVERDCPICNTTFYVRRQDAEDRGRYCSQACFNAARTKGPAYHFWRRVQKGDGCWLWQGRPNKKGYGLFTSGHRTQGAHRWAWELTYGPILDGLHVLHNCPGGDNPACVNPAHLRLGTNADNMLDMVLKGRAGKLTIPVPATALRALLPIVPPEIATLLQALSPE